MEFVENAYMCENKSSLHKASTKLYVRNFLYCLRNTMIRISI